MHTAGGVAPVSASVNERGTWEEQQSGTNCVRGRSPAGCWPKPLALRTCATGEQSVQIHEFIERWRNTQGERANKDSYLKELCRVLGVPEPDGKLGDPEQDRYCFEADAVVYDEDGRRHVGKMDLYRKDCFVLEAKQSGRKESGNAGTASWNTPGWNLAMTDAAGQAFGYARTLDHPPPFVVVADIGQCFDLYACFDGSGAYRAFPNAQKHRLWLKDLEKHADVLRKLWHDPESLDPRRHSERVSQEVAADLAELATELETSGHEPELVAKFLMRCIFTMFAEDIGLLQDKVFTQYLERQWIHDPTSFKDGIEELWAAMNAGKRFYVLGKLLRFNGGLFADPIALELSSQQLRVLVKAAKHDWSEVEPAIFGTLIEQALNPTERHRLGAHFTPAAYVRRLVRPTIEEPLRGEWDIVRVQVRELVVPGEPAKTANVAKARKLVEAFQLRICSARVLDPACGTGNFLYMAFHLFKELESEVLATLDDLGAVQLTLDDNLTVTPKQFLGIELRAGSKEVAELVLWIGYLQWHYKMFGGTKRPPEPILRDYKNIECRDALLTDGALGPCQAQWPDAEFIIGNPPFVGNKLMLGTMGDAYVGALRSAYREVPNTSDLVMYWWHKAAGLVRRGVTARFGLISTKTISQVQNSQIVEQHLGATPPLSLVFVIPNHPWVDHSDGAAVRVAMTVAAAGEHVGTLAEVEEEAAPSANGSQEYTVKLRERLGSIHADLRIGADIRSAAGLQANVGICQQGVKLVQPRDADGFIIARDDLADFGGPDARIIKPYLTNRQLMHRSKDEHVIDFFGFSETDARRAHPRAFQRVLEQVRPFRQKNRDAARKRDWWLFGRSNEQMRASLKGLQRFIVTSEVAKHRVFVFRAAPLVADASLYVIGSDDAFVLGVLSSRAHTTWAIKAGGRMGKGDDPRYQCGPCFDPFPFPERADGIAELAEEIDLHRKRVQAEFPKLELTDIYNVLEKNRSGEPLDQKEKALNKQALVSILLKLHQDLDAAVFSAYGWPQSLSDDELLSALLALNSARSAEERHGTVKWLRKEFQLGLSGRILSAEVEIDVIGAQLKLPWPKELSFQVAAVRDLLNGKGSPLTANDVCESFDGSTPLSVVMALETLEALGLAASYQNGAKRWKGLAKATGERVLYAEDRVKPSSRPPATGTG